MIKLLADGFTEFILEGPAIVDIDLPRLGLQTACRFVRAIRLIVLDGDMAVAEMWWCWVERVKREVYWSKFNWRLGDPNQLLQAEKRRFGGCPRVQLCSPTVQSFSEASVSLSYGFVVMSWLCIQVIDV